MIRALQIPGTSGPFSWPRSLFFDRQLTARRRPAQDRLLRLAGLGRMGSRHQKGFFKQAGVDVEFVWFEYLPSMDACPQARSTR